MIGPAKAFDTDKYFVILHSNGLGAPGNHGPFIDPPGSGVPLRRCVSRQHPFANMRVYVCKGC